MNDLRRIARASARVATLCAAALLAAACHDVVNSGGSAAFSVGGVVTGLVPGASVELANSDGDSATVSVNGIFAFAAALPNGSTYGITVFQQPADENCVVGNGSGTIMGASIASVSVVCTPEVYAVGGTVGGLLPGRSLVLEDDGGNGTTVSANGAFTFSTGVPSGSNYAVTVRTQPDGQSCAISGGTGTMGAGPVLGISVACSDNTYNVAVTVSGLNAAGLILQNNGGDPLSISRNGSANFDTPIASGSAYDITVSSQPTGEVCSVANASGTVTDANVSLAVDCVPNLYSIGGSLSGLYAGRSLVVQNNGSNSTTLSANGSFAFSTPIASGSGYSVTVLTQPAGQTCSLTHGSGTVSGAAVANVAISCSDNTYNVGFTVRGLLSTGLILEDNGADPFTVSSNGVFNFDTPLQTGSAYSVTILTQPASETCAITDGSGTIVAASITEVLVTCTGAWAWMGGPSVDGQPGAYGTQGNPSPNNMPGARSEAATFTDASGNFWLFGGVGWDSAGTFPGDLNDLWTYDPGSGVWTWISGSNVNGASGNYGGLGPPPATGVPGARAQPGAWTDRFGNFWVFGGHGYDSGGNPGVLNDLWRFSPGIGAWTWVSGANTVDQYGTYGTSGVGLAGNVPGARTGAVSWTDSAGNLWLFGGQGYAASAFGYLNDLWTFNPGTGIWTWVSGSKLSNQAGTYGAQGKAAIGNAPGGRTSASTWVDSLGNLWLFGGIGVDSASNFGYLNDLWEFNPTAGTWTWVAGSATSNGNSNYGQQGIPAASNLPGGRDVATAWVDSSGNFWLFGGDGLDSSNTLPAGNLGDLWEFSPATGLWTWIDGSNVAGDPGIYGAPGVGTFGNAPGARQAAAPWVDSSGNLWLLGGLGVDSNDNSGDLDDLWKYTP